MSKPRQPKEDKSGNGGNDIVSFIDEAGVAVYIASLDRVFSFSFLLSVCSITLSRKIALAICRDFARGLADRTVVARFNILRGFFKYIAENSELLIHLKEATVDHRLGNVETWRACIQSWFRNGLREYGDGHLTTFGEKVNGLRALVGILERERFMPKIKFPEMPRNYHFDGGRKPSLIEVRKKDGLLTDVIDLVKDRARELGAVDGLDASYMQDLANRIPAEFLLSRDAYAQAMQRVNNELLVNIRMLAERKFLGSYEIFLEGAKYIESADLDDVCRLHRIVEEYKRKHRAGESIEMVFSALRALFSNDSDDHSIAILLCYFKSYSRGVVFMGERDDARTKAFLSKLYGRFGGVRRLTKLLGGDPDAIAAAMLLYMVDSGANPSVAMELRPDCMQPASDPRQMRIDSIKARAGWAPIVHIFDLNEAEVKITVPRAIQIVCEMTDGIRVGFPQFKNTLFLFRWYEEPSAASTEFLANRLSYFVRDAGLDTKIYRLDGIRQSFILDRTLEADGNTRLAEIVAAHKSENGSVIKIYTDRWPIRVLLSKKIAHFQNLLQIDVLFNGAGLDEAWQINKTDAENILLNAERTGHGLRCRNPLSGVGPTSKEGEDCQDVGAFCIGCEQRLFVVDEESVRDLVRQKMRLESVREEMEATATRRWEVEGLPLLAFSIAVLEKMKRSPYAALLKKVTEQESQRQEQQCDRKASN